MIEKVVAIARDAANVLRERSARDFTVDYKGKDDPVTTVDREINTLVCDALARAFPAIPIVAEEGRAESWEVRKTAREAFFVDPVDGTRELIARNGQFCVMIGLAREGRAALGVVAWPSEERTFFATEHAAFEIARDGIERSIRVTDVASPGEAAVLVSRSHPDAKTDAILDKIRVREKIPFGSTGLKVAKVASGEAQAYVHVTMRGGGKLWDACGPEAIARAAGAKFTDPDGGSIDYRGELGLPGLIVATPNVHGWLLEALRT